MNNEMKPPQLQQDNLAIWQHDANHLLLLQPFMDSVIVGGDGCYLIDVEGRRILDLAAGQFCSILGHRHSGFISRLQEQSAKLIHLGDQYVSPGILSAVSKLASKAPGSLTKAVLLSTGSEANECAMRMAKAVTGRTGMLAFSRGYYGISLATRNLSSISDHPGKSDFQPAPAHQDKLITPTCNRCPIQQQYPACGVACLETSIDFISQHMENIAAVIVEPVLSAGGMIFPPKDYLQRLHAAAKKSGILFIVDEAQTGFGRCGEWFDIQHYQIDPDIMVVSKTAGNGYPAAAVIVSDVVAAQLERIHFTHLSSHQNDPLAAAAILAVIDTVEEENLVEHSRKMGDYFKDQLEKLKSKHEIIKDVRGRGLMIAVELSSEENSDRLAFETAMLCEQRGLHITYSYYEPVMRIIPPLIISKSEIDLAVCVLDEVLGLVETRDSRVNDIIPKNCRSGPFISSMVKRSPGALLRKMWSTSPQQWLEKVRSIGERA
jgi:2,2-dialkylglycine decarboxylase (pyruvate)